MYNKRAKLFDYRTHFTHPLPVAAFESPENED